MDQYLTLEFLFYLLRWVSSAFVMFVPLYLINRFHITDRFKHKEYIDLILVSIIGAFVYYRIDKILLSN